MRGRANWVAGLVVLAGGGVATAQTTTGGMRTGSGVVNLSTPIPRGTGTTTTGSTGGAMSQAGGKVNLSTPIPWGNNARGAAGGTGQGGTGQNGSGRSFVGFGSGTPLSGMPPMYAFGLPGTGPGASRAATPLTAVQEVALLAQARLLVTELESTGNVTLDRRESLLLTLIVYEILRQQAVQAGLGAGGTATTPAPGATTP